MAVGGQPSCMVNGDCNVAFHSAIFQTKCSTLLHEQRPSSIKVVFMMTLCLNVVNANLNAYHTMHA